MKKWYAVQNGSDFDCGYGSTNKREAMKMARKLCKDAKYDGQEIRIAVCFTESDDVTDEIIVREGSRD